MIVDVAIPVRVASSFHYLIDDALASQIQAGSIVEVPWGKSRKTHAFVLGLQEKTDVAPDKLKSVSEILLPEPVFDEVMLKFLRWVSQYYCHPLGEVFDAAIPRTNIRPPKKRRASKKTLDFTLLGQEAAQKPVLTDEQAKAVAEILNVEEKRPFLLHGVTGSGKTEIYMRVLEALVEQGKGAIVLVPEIALTPQLLGRFASRFPDQVAVLHSDLTPNEKADQWEKVRSGQSKIVIGARSAVFAPVKNLGLIVVDEEQEASFKQEDSLRYNARDLAVVRAGFAGAKVILGSATPSLETYYNANQGKYCYIELKKRVEDRALPKTTFIDIKNKENWSSSETPWLSRYLIGRMEQTLAAKQQSVLYLNRLGFAHFLFCKDCGNTWRCPNCDVSLTYYKHPPCLKCHYCALEMEVPAQCDVCQGCNLDTIGLGTEQVEKQLKEIFPEARICRMDRGAIKNRKDLEAVLGQVSRGEMDIVIGTQMVAKGHDFPGIALIGILIADASLNMPDFRSNERTFQIVTQVSGRAGRAGIPGEVVIQTINPEQPVLKWAAENRSQEFYAAELAARKVVGFPPFQKMALMRFQHSKTADVSSYSEELARLARAEIKRRGLKCTLFGPFEAPLARLKNLHRYHLLLKSESVKDLQIVLKILQAYDIARKSSVQFAVDVDPLNSM